MAHKIKAIECILDWSLWPRFEAEELDSTNLARMKMAMEAGIALPPIIVNADDMTVTDGFHRVTASLQLYGDGSEIMAEERRYESKGEQFCEAVALNAKQGLPLSPRDKAHSIMRLRKLHVPATKIAIALGMDKDAMSRWLDERTAMVKSGERIPIPGSAKHLSIATRGEKPLTSAQEHYVRTTPGVGGVIFFARQLLNAIRANEMKYTESDIELFGELIEALKVVAA